MKVKKIMRATMVAATLVVAGYGGMKAYEHSYGQKVNSDESMLMANIEALTEEGENGGNPCPDPRCPESLYLLFNRHDDGNLYNKRNSNSMW